MEIESIEIKNIMGSILHGKIDGVEVSKILPCLSLVQSCEGRYEISLDGKKSVYTDEGGAFVAPTGALQNIVHHSNNEGVFSSQWIFMDVTVNDIFALEDVFELPLTIGAEHRDVLDRCISQVVYGNELCKKYAAAYEALELIIDRSVMREKKFDTAAANLKKYIDEHYTERLTKEKLAEVALCSVPNLYRIFNKNFGMSPHNYVNKVRLEKAALLLEYEKMSIAQTAQAVGIEDEAYFSKLFKSYYELSPNSYRFSLLREKHTL